MNILIRLPNWLGDLVMSSVFVQAVKKQFPDSKINVIVKKNLSDLIALFPDINQIYELKNSKQFGFISYLRNLKLTEKKKFDLFFCLPNSFSSALSGYFSNSYKRVGYKCEFRSFLLTNAFTKPKNKHRVEEYLYLLERYCSITIPQYEVSLKKVSTHQKITPAGKNLVFNINSEAQSRRIPISKSAEIIEAIKHQLDFNILLIGSNNEIEYLKLLETKLKDRKNIYNLCGRTNLTELVQLISESDYILTTDSGIAHIANGFKKKMIVFFGAGDELVTRPYNKGNLKIIRAQNIECAPCISNRCKYGIPICLTEIKTGAIIEALDELQNKV